MAINVTTSGGSYNLTFTKSVLIQLMDDAIEEMWNKGYGATTTEEDGTISRVNFVDATNQQKIDCLENFLTKTMKTLAQRNRARKEMANVTVYQDSEIV